MSCLQDFLDSTSSQLTEHGLCALQQGLHPNELAVFFRNNHFNTLFLHKGGLHILVTDQGYEYEKVLMQANKLQGIQERISMTSKQHICMTCAACTESRMKLLTLNFSISSLKEIELLS